MPDDTNSRLATHLVAHPRLAGALFTLLLLVSQAGAAAATGNTVIFGP